MQSIVLQSLEMLTILKNYHSEWIIKKEADINRESFMKHFNFQNPSDMLKNLYQINDKEKKLNYRM